MASLKQLKFSTHPRYTTYYCAIINMPMLFGSTLMLLAMLFLGFERLFALLRPIKFREICDKHLYFYSVVTFLCVCSMTFTCLSFYGIDNSVKPYSCTPNFIRIVALKKIVSYFYFAAGFAILVVYSEFIIFA